MTPKEEEVSLLVSSPLYQFGFHNSAWFMQLQALAAPAALQVPVSATHTASPAVSVAILQCLAASPTLSL